jgi:uncharacterized membrane protein
MAKRKSKARKQERTADKAAAERPAEIRPAARDSAKESARPAAGRRRSLPNWPLLAPALLGMALTGYLAVTAWLGEAPLLCTDGSGCDLVQSSRWGSFLGLPTSAWGFVGYAAIGFVAYRVKDAARHWQFGWTLALVGLAVSLYLTVVSLVLVEATCLYCLASLALMAVIFGVATAQRPAGLEGFSWPVWGGQTALVAILVVGALHLYYRGTFDASVGPEDPYLKGLAVHLSSSGAVFYGAYW